MAAVVSDPVMAFGVRIGCHALPQSGADHQANRMYAADIRAMLAEHNEWSRYANTKEEPADLTAHAVTGTLT